MERPASGESICRIVLLGPASDSSRDQLIKGLQGRFKLTVQQAETLLRKTPVVVKRGLTIEKANSLLQRLEEIGARVRIERVFPDQEEAPPKIQKLPPQEAISPKAEDVSPESYCLWEDMENVGFLKAYFGTIGEVLFYPSKFFSRIPVDQGLIRPLVFALVMGVLGGMFGLLYQFLLMQFVGAMFEYQEFADFRVPIMIGSAIGLPIITIIGVFIFAGVLHVCLMIVRGNQKGFEATFRVIAYAMSTEIFAVIPFLGGLIGTVYSLVIWILGTRETHRISTGKAAFAVLLPILAIFALGVLIILAVIIPLVFQATSG
ncbi:MAG: hypothetical protein GTO12_12470 [Proteobacteria bacterium]|nr:hypothetical protein [Pseudomonadota bacterium]